MYNFECTDIIKCHNCGFVYTGDGDHRCPTCKAGIVYQCWEMRPYSAELIQEVYNGDAKRSAKALWRDWEHADETTRRKIIVFFLEKGIK